MHILSKHINKIKTIFNKNSVVFAYLFGSQATKNTGKLSDIDIAVFFSEKIDKDKRFDKKLRIMAELSLLLKRDDIDVVVLNDAYPLLEHRIVKSGVVIFSRDEKKRLDYELKAIMGYLDFKPFIDKYTKETLSVYGR